MKKQQKTSYQNPWEAFGDIGKSVAKEVVETLNPLSPLFRTERTSTGEKVEHANQSGEKQQELLKKQTHTPLDFGKLEKSYRQQDDEKYQALQKQYFEREKAEEARAIEELKKEKEKKKRTEAKEEHEKKQEKQQQEQAGPESEAHGKIRAKFGQPQHRKATTSFENKGQFGR